MITAVVGAGGKTSLIHAMADSYRREGKKVFVATTTHMFIEPDTLLTDDIETILHQLNSTGYAMAGLPDREKLCPLPQPVYETICTQADEVLVEADGSRHHAIKFPRSYEPVIPANTRRIIVVCGLHALGKPLKEAAFRKDEVMRCLNADENTVITPAHIQKLVRKGYLEPLKQQFPQAEIQVHAAGGSTLFHRAVGALLEADLDVNLIQEDWFAPKPCLFLCGAGHVARELGEFAAKLDFRVRVLDDRETFANRERFPFAEEVICTDFQNLGEHLVPGAYYAVLTPGHQNDLLCVQTILGSAYRYLGMIGSHAKVAKTFDSLLSAGFSQAQVDTVHAPIGLSIGAATPAEIAISILAELIQEKNKSSTASVSAELLHSDKHGMLCIIIEKTGSAPRGVGSMMLVTDTEVLDTIGGGPVEYAAIRDARENHLPAVRTYNLCNTDSHSLGMICGGTNQVLFLPI